MHGEEAVRLWGGRGGEGWFVVLQRAWVLKWSKLEVIDGGCEDGSERGCCFVVGEAGMKCSRAVIRG